MAGQGSNAIRMDIAGFDHWTAVDVYDLFSLGPAPGYNLHVGTNLNSTGSECPTLKQP